MATTTNNLLYPPIIDTFMPAFSKDADYIPVYFSLSQYNANKTVEVNYLHVSVVNQVNNIQALATTWEPGPNSKIDEVMIDGVVKDGIWIVPFTSPLLKKQNNGLYLLKIPKEIFKDPSAEFKIDYYYKLQLRLDMTAKGNNGIKNDSQYLTDNRSNFSEWSRVCLLRAIPQPILSLHRFSDEEHPTFNPGIIPVSGNLTFNIDAGSKTSETLQSYCVTIYSGDEPTVETIAAYSGEIFTGDEVDPNNIYWLADMEEGKSELDYTLQITYTTKNQYSKTETFPLYIYEYASNSDLFNSDGLKFEFEFHETDNTSLRYGTYNADSGKKIITAEDGFVEFDVKGEAKDSGYLYIKRASNRDGFKKWDLLSCTASNGHINVHFTDRTPGSLVEYIYSVQYQTRKGTWSKSFKSKTWLFNKATQKWYVEKGGVTVYPDFYDVLLSRKDKQLAVRANAQVSNLRPVINRQKIDTLGGKYPRFTENATLNYRQFTISGYIDAETDFNRKFLSELDYDREMQVYDSQMNGKYELRNDTIPDKEPYTFEDDDSNVRNFNKHSDHDIYPKDNWWWQREFREQALEWLNDGEPKLFRTMTEGNIIVILSDISLTPNTTVSRRLYEFSATAYEVGDGYSYESLASLGIVDIDDDREVSYDDETIEINDLDYIKKRAVGQILEKKFVGNPKDLHPIMGYYTDTPPEGRTVVLQDAATTTAAGLDYKNMTIRDLYQYLYYESGKTILGKLYDLDEIDIPLTLLNLSINFESKPTWWIINGDTIEPYNQEIDTNTTSSLALGYKIGLIEKGSNKIVDIFVNRRGYYQVPNGLEIINLFIYGNATVTINYILEYALAHNTDTIAQTTELVKKIVGQLSGTWDSSVSFNDLITKKYESYKYHNGKMVEKVRLDKWSGVSLEVTPYAEVKVVFADDPTPSNFLVGRNGYFQFPKDTEINELIVLGRRLIEVADDKDDYLDEWEFRWDDSAIPNLEYKLTWDQYQNFKYTKTNTEVLVNQDNNINPYWNNFNNELALPQIAGYVSTDEIENPQYNTVYGFKPAEGSTEKTYKIYYLDQGWYPIEFYKDDVRDAIRAKVPVYGMINYKGNIIKQTF